MQNFDRYRVTVYTWLTAGVIFLIPSNLFVKMAESSAYVNGLLVDYLLPKFYLSDVLIITLLLVWLTEIPVKNIWSKLQRLSPLSLLFLIATAALGFRQLAAPYPIAAWWFWLKLVEMVLLGIFLVKHQQLLRQNYAKIALAAAIIFQSVLALYQFFTQRSLWGYWLLGEPNLSRMIGVAKLDIGGAVFTAPYGTTAHPNILAGCVTIMFLLLVLGLRRPLLQRKNWWLASLSIPVLAVLYVTQSWSAAASLVLAGAFIGLSHAWVLVAGSVGLFWLTPLLLDLASGWSASTSVLRRAWLNTAAINVWRQDLIRGSGLNNFTAVFERYGANPELVRFVQPAHHVGLLWLAETGLIGLLWLAVGLFLLATHLNRHQWLLLAIKVAIMLPIAAIDHYVLTLQTGLLLLTFWLCWPTTLFSKKHN